jgi:hypothetical protein
VQAVVRFVFAARAQQRGAHGGDRGGEVLAGVALVGDDQLTAVKRPG